MDILGAILGSLVGVVIGIFGGLKIGGWLRSRASWVYWTVNAAALVLGMAAVFVGLTYEIEAVWVGGIAFMGGSLTGLKYGFGRSVGLWRTVDNITGTDDLPKG